MAAAETGDLSDASVETVEQNTGHDEDDKEHGFEHGDDNVDDGGSGSDEEEEDEPFFEILRAPCAGEILAVITIPVHTGTGKGKGSVRPQKFVFLRVLERLLFGVGHGAYSSVLRKAVEKLGLEASLRTCERKTCVPDMMTEPQWMELLGYYNECARAADPHCGAARRFGLVPKSLAVTLALKCPDRTVAKQVLQALGRKPPERWEHEARQAELRSQNATCFNTEAALDKEDEDDMALVALEDELTGSYQPFEAVAADEQQSRTYALKKPSQQLEKELRLYRERRESPLCRYRHTKQVQSNTVDSDHACALRFLGFVKDHRSDAESVPTPPLTISGVWGSEYMGAWTQDFMRFLAERDVKWSSQSNYVAGLINIMYWAEADPEFELTQQHGFTQLQQMINLRRQAESHAAQDNLYKRRDKNWISWKDAHLTRLEAIRAYKAAKGQAKRELLRDVLVISLLTIQPPDRVGVIRLLKVGSTLKRLPHSEDEGASVRWWIDLRSRSGGRHKTSRFYGPAMTVISDKISHYLEQYLEQKAGASTFDFEPESTSGPYLFSTGTDRRQLSSSQWTSLVKGCFQRHSPTHVATPPKLDATPEILKSACHTMKHAIETQESDRYDQETHERLTKAAFDHCLQFSDEIESQVASGSAPSSQSAAEPSRTTPSKGRKPKASKPPRTPSKPKPTSRRMIYPAEPPPPAVDLTTFIDKTVKRSFNGVWYDATVTFVKPWYRLTFTDGDVQDLTSADFKSLTEGVFEGASLHFHCGEPWRWVDVVVQERYEGKKPHGPIWEADNQPFNSTARDCWVVEFTQEGEYAPIDLRITRKVSDTTGSVPGTWTPAL